MSAFVRRHPWLSGAVLLLLISAPVAAGTFYALSEFGIRYLPMSSVPPNCTSPDKACAWVKSSDGHLYQHQTTGLDEQIDTSSQLVAFSATPAFNCTVGNLIHFGPVTANVTGPTMVAGSPGQECHIVMLKDGTGGTFTVAGWGSNVRFNGTATFTSGAGSLVNLTFVWDDQLSAPAWVEHARTGYN